MDALPLRGQLNQIADQLQEIVAAPLSHLTTISSPPETSADPTIALSSSVFKPMWDVIRALRSHDEELGRQLDELRRQLGCHGGRPRLPTKIHRDIPKKVGAAFADAFDVRLVVQTTASWEFWFGLLEQFVAISRRWWSPACNRGA